MKVKVAEEGSPAPPTWLRPLAWGCAAVVVVLAAGLAWGTCSLRRLVTSEFDRLTGQVLAALPGSMPEAERAALSNKLACAREALRRPQGNGQALGALARTCRQALADSQLTQSEVAAIVAAAERVCPSPESRH